MKHSKTIKGFFSIACYSSVFLVSSCSFMQPEQDRVRKIRQDEVNSIMQEWEVKQDSLAAQSLQDSLTFDSLD